jgi:integrase
MRKTIGTNREVAKDVLKELEGKAVRGEYGLKDNRYSLLTLKDAFLRHKRLTLKPRTYGGYKQDLELVLDSLKVDLVSDITPSLLDTFIEARLGCVSERTVNLEVLTLRQMLEYGVNTGLTANNPIADFKPLKVRQKRFRRVLSNGEIDRLLGASNPTYRPVWYCLLTTGIRKSELVSLTWDDIDWCTKEILIQSKDGFSTKTGEIRKIPIVDELYETLKELKGKAASKHVFVNSNGNPLRNHLLTVFKRTVRRAGINQDGLDLHSLRYTFISSLLRGGANPKSVQRLAGHKRMHVTMDIYAKVLPDEERQAIKKLPYATYSGEAKVLLLAQEG